jgi:hypothetical protein
VGEANHSRRQGYGRGGLTTLLPFTRRFANSGSTAPTRNGPSGLLQPSSGSSPPSRITASSALLMASGRVGLGSDRLAIQASSRASCSGWRRTPTIVPA